MFVVLSHLILNNIISYYFFYKTQTKSFYSLGKAYSRQARRTLWDMESDDGSLLNLGGVLWIIGWVSVIIVPVEVGYVCTYVLP